MHKYILLFSTIFINVLFGTVDEYIVRIQTFLGDGEYLKANEEFELAITKYDANASLYFIGGQVAVRLDRLNDADKHYKKSIELDNKNKDYRLAQEKLAELNKALANARKTYESGLINDAIIEYEKLTKTYQQYAIVFYNLGRVYKVNEEYDLAAQNYKKAGGLNPFESKYVNAIKGISNDMIKNGDAEYRMQEYDTAMGYYNKSIHYAPQYAPTYFKVANVYLKLQDIDKAIESLKIGLSYDSSYAKIYLMLGKLYKKKNKIKLSKISINSAININRNYTKAYFELGQIYYDEGNFDFAIKEYKNAIGSDSTYQLAYLTLGLSELNIKEYSNAELYYRKAIKIDGKYLDAYYRLSELYNLQQKYSEAKDIAKQAIYIKQNYAPAYHELGIAEMYLCNVIAAQNSFEKAKKDRTFRQSSDSYLKNIDYYTKECN